MSRRRERGRLFRIIQLAQVVGRLMEVLHTHSVFHTESVETKMRKRTWHIKAILIFVSLGSGLAYFSISDLRSGNAASHKERRIAYTSNLGHEPRVPADASAQDIIATIVRRYGGSGVRSAAIGQRPAVAGLRPGTWLHFSVRVQARDERVNRPEWEADLIEGTVADALASSGGRRCRVNHRLAIAGRDDTSKHGRRDGGYCSGSDLLGRDN